MIFVWQGREFAGSARAAPGIRASIATTPELMAGDHSLDLLHEAYVDLRDAWMATCTDQGRDYGSPAFRWRQGDDNDPITARHCLMQAGELAAVNATQGVLHAPRVLVRAYPPTTPRGGAVEEHDWPGLAHYPLARSILEGSSVAAWLQDPELTDDERLLRSARIMVWSQNHDLDAPEEQLQDPDYVSWLHTVRDIRFHLGRHPERAGARGGRQTAWLRLSIDHRGRSRRPGTSALRTLERPGAPCPVGSPVGG